VSTYWGLRCIDCDECSPHWFTHGSHILKDVVGLWPHIKAVVNAPSGYLEIHFLGGYDDIEDTRLFTGEEDSVDYDAQYQQMMDAADYYYEMDGDR